MKKYLITLPKLSPGGTERTAATFGNYLAENGEDVTILTMSSEKVFYDLHPHIKLIFPSVSRKTFGKFIYTVYLIFFIRYHVLREKPSIVFAIGYISLLLLSTIGIKTKVVISRRSSPFRIRFPSNKILNSIYYFFRKRLAFRVDGIIAQTSISAEVLREEYNCPIEVIPNFLREIQQFNLPKLKQIISVGRYSNEKGQQYLIESFSMLDAPDWQLILIGDGPMREFLNDQIKSLGLQDRVKLKGFKENVDWYLSQSEIFALTSTIEGFPNALIEAMAIPLPVVSFDCFAGPSDIIIDGQNGFLVEVGNTQEFANKLQYLIDNEDIRKKITKESIKVRSKYSLSKIGYRYKFFLDNTQTK